MKASVVKRQELNRLPKVGEVFTVMHEWAEKRGPCIRIDDKQGTSIDIAIRPEEFIFSVYLGSGREEAFFRTRKYTILNPVNNGQIFKEK